MIDARTGKFVYGMNYEKKLFVKYSKREANKKSFSYNVYFIANL